MIEVIYYREHNCLTAVGHAHSDELGRDLVCAGVSTLVYTLAANVQQMEGSGQVRNMSLELKEGNARISCDASHKYRSTVERIYQAVCVGFEILATEYPQFIRYEIRG